MTVSRFSVRCKSVDLEGEAYGSDMNHVFLEFMQEETFSSVKKLDIGAVALLGNAAAFDHGDNPDISSQLHLANADTKSREKCSLPFTNTTAEVMFWLEYSGMKHKEAEFDKALSLSSQLRVGSVELYIKSEPPDNCVKYGGLPDFI